MKTEPTAIEQVEQLLCDAAKVALAVVVGLVLLAAAILNCLPL